MERERKNKSIIRYNAFEIPAHQYAFQKTANYGQVGGLIGFFIGVGNHVISKAPPTVATTIARIATPIGVLAATGITYGTLLSLLGTLRGKDDAKNHLIAGFCAGAIPGSLFKANPVGGAVYFGVFIGLSAGIIKATYLRNGGKQRIVNIEGMTHRNQMTPLWNDVETKPEYAKYFT